MSKPNILLVMTDEHTPAVAGYAGDSVVRTQHLDKLAAGSVQLPWRRTLPDVREQQVSQVFLGRDRIAGGLSPPQLLWIDLQRDGAEVADIPDAQLCAALQILAVREDVETVPAVVADLLHVVEELNRIPDVHRAGHKVIVEVAASIIEVDAEQHVEERTGALEAAVSEMEKQTLAGADVLNALTNGARRVVGAELDPVTVEILTSSGPTKR